MREALRAAKRLSDILCNGPGTVHCPLTLLRNYEQRKDLLLDAAANLNLALARADAAMLAVTLDDGTGQP